MERLTPYCSVPELELKVDYSACLNNATHKFISYWQSMLLVTFAFMIIGFVLQTPLSFAFSSSDIYSALIANFGWSFYYVLAILIVFCLFFYGYIYVSLKVARDEKPAFKDLVLPFKRFFSVIFSAVVLALIIGIGFFLFVVPGVVLLCRLIFVPHLILDRGENVFKAIAVSWEMTSKYFWTIFFMGLAMTVIGALLALLIYFMAMVFAFGDGSASLLAGDASLYWVVYLVTGVIFIPVIMYNMIAWGSLYNGIIFENPVPPVMRRG